MRLLSLYVRAKNTEFNIEARNRILEDDYLQED
jgi:hypothetical protein